MTRCQHCYYWKRRNDIYGTCWHPTQTGSLQVPHGTCEHHTPKVIRVTTQPGHMTADRGHQHAD